MGVGRSHVSSQLTPWRSDFSILSSNGCCALVPARTAIRGSLVSTLKSHDVQIYCKIRPITTWLIVPLCLNCSTGLLRICKPAFARTTRNTPFITSTYCVINDRRQTLIDNTTFFWRIRQRTVRLRGARGVVSLGIPLLRRPERLVLFRSGRRH